MCADNQGTGSDTWEYFAKLRPIGQFSLIACAGVQSYFELLIDYVEDALSEAGSKDYYKTLNSAIDSYCAQIRKRTEEVGYPPSLLKELVKQSYPQGVFATYDRSLERYRLFEIATPHPCVEVPKYPRRATVGSGSRPAFVFLKNVEYLMLRKELQLHWTDFSMKLVAQFCTILLRRIEHVDPFTAGSIFYTLGKEFGVAPLPAAKIWENCQEKYQLTSLLKNAISEIPKQKSMALLNTYELTNLAQWLGLLLAQE